MDFTKKFRLSALAILVVAVVGLTLLWKNFVTSPIISNDSGFIYKVHPGASFNSVAADLQSQHILKHPSLFLLLVKLRFVKHELKAGEYLFPKGSTPNSMIDQMISGQGIVLHLFKIIAGTTFKQVRMNLDNDPDLLHTTKNLDDASIMKMLGHPELNAEGEFYPDTYYFVADTSDLLLLKRSFKAMQKKLEALWQTHAANIPFKNAYEALIAASLIEKEAHLDSERPVIAGVMVNRLRKNMILQFDPTVIYGMGDKYQGVLHHHDLLVKTPYNTYLNKGLPPTPIAMPGLASIQAAMHPDSNDYFYFVAKGDHTSHYFSKTLQEQNVAIAKSKKMSSSLSKKIQLKSSSPKAFSQANK